METNRFYKIDNPKEKQFTTEYINLDDISSVHLPNESMNLGIVVMKTGKDIYIHREELDKLLKCLTLINSEDIDNISKVFDIYEFDTTYFPGK